MIYDFELDDSINNVLKKLRSSNVSAEEKEKLSITLKNLMEAKRIYEELKD